MMRTNYKTVADYLADQPEDALAALSKLRQSIAKLVPEAEEYISYQIPTFKYMGKPLVAYGGYKGHCSLYTMSKQIIQDIASDSKAFEQSGTTIRFSANQSLPAGLIKKIILARKKEIAELLKPK